MTRHPPPALPHWLETMLPPGAARYRIDVGGYRMHVTEWGEGRPVLALHGNPTWGFLYRKVAAAFHGTPFRVVAPDLIGLGFSDKPRALRVHQLVSHARWVRSLIEQLDLRDIVFVGQDWGGPIGGRALADVPDRLAGMVLANTVASPPGEGFRPTRFHRFARRPVVSDVTFRIGGFPQNTLHTVQGDPASISGDVARAYTYPLRRWRDRTAPLALARMVPHSHEHPSIEALRTCQTFVESFAGPSALVWGERDPILGRVVGWMEKLLPQAEVTRTQAGHFLQEEVPDAIAAAIRSVAQRSARD